MTIYSIPPLLTLISFICLSALTIKYGRWTKADILFFAICLIGSFLYVDILLVSNVKSLKTALLISRTDHIFVVYLFPLYLHFFHVYLGIKNKKGLILAAYVYSFILMWFTQSPLYIETMQKYSFGFFAKGGVLYPFFGITCIFVTIYTVLLLSKAIRSEQSNIRKYKLKYVLSGFGVMGILNSLNILPMLGISVYPPGNLSFIPLIVFGIGIFRHDLLDTGILIKKGLVYSILTSLLTGLYVLLLITAKNLLSGFDFFNSIYFSIIFFLGIAVLFEPLKARIQAIVDRIFLKGKYEYQKTIKDISKMITSVLSVNDISKHLMEAVTKTMEVEDCTLFLHNHSYDSFKNISSAGNDTKSIPETLGEDSLIVRMLNRSLRPILRSQFQREQIKSDYKKIIAEFESLNAAIVVPMVFREKLNGFLCLGEKRSGDLFSPEDMDLLETLAAQSSLAFENAMAYEKMNELNKNLERKIDERTLALKNALYEKDRSQEQLIRAESLAAIGQLVAGTAHELNNPLASVISILQSSIEDLNALDVKTQLENDFFEDLKFSEQELKRAKSIVDSLLGLSRQTQSYSEPVNINNVIKDSLKMLNNQFKNDKLTIAQNYATNLPLIKGNFSNLGQVAINIIKNAIQAIKKTEGEIILNTRHDKDKNHVVFECIDTGPGVLKSRRQDIFKPFFTTKPAGEGTGLGLYICHEIVKRHGGTIELEDNNGKGAKFVVNLPLDNEC